MYKICTKQKTFLAFMVFILSCGLYMAMPQVIQAESTTTSSLSLDAAKIGTPADRWTKTEDIMIGSQSNRTFYTPDIAKTTALGVSGTFAANHNLARGLNAEANNSAWFIGGDIQETTGEFIAIGGAAFTSGDSTGNLVYVGYKKSLSSIDVSKMLVTAPASTVFAGYGHANASNNHVFISGKVTIKDATGGASVAIGQGASGTVENNSVTIFAETGATTTATLASITGGESDKGSANKNTVTVHDGTVSSIIGGLGLGNGTEQGIANNNTVTFMKGEFNNIIGGEADKAANNNIVTVNGGTKASVDTSFWIKGGESTTGSANNNIVTVKGTVGLIDIFGGDAQGSGAEAMANNNTVILGDIESNPPSSTAINDFSALVKLQGRLDPNSTPALPSTGNTLNLGQHVTMSATGLVSGFEKYTFTINDETVKAGTFLTAETIVLGDKTEFTFVDMRTGIAKDAAITLTLLKDDGTGPSNLSTEIDNITVNEASDFTVVTAPAFANNAITVKLASKGRLADGGTPVSITEVFPLSEQIGDVAAAGLAIEQIKTPVRYTKAEFAKLSEATEYSPVPTGNGVTVYDTVTFGVKNVKDGATLIFTTDFTFAGTNLPFNKTNMHFQKVRAGNVPALPYTLIYAKPTTTAVNGTFWVTNASDTVMQEKVEGALESNRNTLKTGAYTIHFAITDVTSSTSLPADEQYDRSTVAGTIEDPARPYTSVGGGTVPPSSSSSSGCTVSTSSNYTLALLLLALAGMIGFRAVRRKA